MKVTRRNKTMTFDKKKVEKLDFDEFDKICRESSVFKDMPPKERTKKIKSLYNENIGKKKKTTKSKSAKHISEDSQPGRGLPGSTEQESTEQGTESNGKQDNPGI